MFLVIPVLFLGFLVPVFCVGLLMDKNTDPTMQALALLILSPYVFLIVRILRINL